MADIEMVIKIDEEVYKKAKETHDVMCDSVWLGIKYGTPLPKGHGRLFDADELLKHTHTIGTSNYCEYNVVYVDAIKEASKIIEADKESEE